MLTEGCLADLDGHQGLRLLDVLNAAHAPYEQALARQRERREATEAERERLLEEPEAMREHLHRNERSLSPYIEAFDPRGQQALKLLIASEDRSLPREREALRLLARDLGDALLEPGSSTTCSPAQPRGACRPRVGRWSWAAWRADWAFVFWSWWTVTVGLPTG